MKKALLIKKGNFWELIQYLQENYGAPSCHEEIVIYIDNKESEYLKTVITPSKLKWSWFDKRTHDPIVINNDIIKRRYNNIVTSLRHLKSKLVFLAINYGNKGQISTSSVFTFKDNESDFKIELRPTTLVGELVTVIAPESIDPTQTLYQKLESYLKELSKHVETHDALKKKISKLDEYKEFIHRFGDSWQLDSIILEFCQKNGILSVFKEKNTFRELLEAKDNNYSLYEKLFEKITNTPLLSRNHNFTEIVKKHDVSIIIPYYNSEESIKQVLLGIQHQKINPNILNSLEVIIIDDNSIKPVENVIESKAYPFKIKIIRLSENSGASHARQLGTLHSSGEILIFIDSDIILSKYYLADHIIRNTIIDNAVFVSFKENVERSDSKINEENIVNGLPLSDYSKEIRTSRFISQDTIGFSDSAIEQQINILEETHYFKNFHGSRVMAIFDLSAMVIGHNFSVKKSILTKTNPFSKDFKGWGMEDHFFGIKVVIGGSYIIPVLSSSVYHMDHEPRSGSEEKKALESRKNIEKIKRFLDQVDIES
ncbi:glycosyltransferase family A protein [Ascidiimonas sp. W6]|uniref:glycosyltransferase family A protein n=1 Tax=Ascidiimonas meishanensis TaxID=3128903 RepID=UPI0030ECCB5D